MIEEQLGKFGKLEYNVLADMMPVHDIDPLSSSVVCHQILVGSHWGPE